MVERAAGEHQAAAKSLTEAEALLRQADAKDPLAECLCEQGLLTIGLEGHAEKLLAEALDIAFVPFGMRMDDPNPADLGRFRDVVAELAEMGVT